MKGASNELQQITLIAFINDQYILGKTIDEIKDVYFSNSIYCLIYKCLKQYYNKYRVIPSLNEISLLVSDMCSKSEDIQYEDVKGVLQELYETKISSEDFLYEKVIDFIRRNKIEGTINKVANYIQGDEIDLEDVSRDLTEDLSVSLNLNRDTTYQLSDITQIGKIREQALGDSDNPMLIPFFIKAVNDKMQYKALPPGTLNMISASPGSGKTTLMINQGMYVAQQGFNVLHIFLGDMSLYDGTLRYISNISGVDTNKLVDFSVKELQQFIAKYNMTGVLANIWISSYAQCELTATKLIEEIQAQQKNNRVHFDMIIVDYDENISKDDEDNIYESGGLIYNKLGLFAVTNRSVVFIVAQPKQAYWSQEVIPLEATAESSKKQKIIDTMITMGKPSRSSKVGTLFIAKNRRGEVGDTFKIKINGANSRIEHISFAEYNKIRAEEIESEPPTENNKENKYANGYKN